MRHRVAHRKLGRVTEHRIAMLRNQATALLRHEHLTTTVPRAKELRPFVERLITIAKRGRRRTATANGKALHARRLVMQDLQDREVVDEAVRHARAALRRRGRAATRGCCGWASGGATRPRSRRSSSSAASSTRARRPKRKPRKPKRRRRRRASAAACGRRPSGCAARRTTPRPTRRPKRRPAGKGQASGQDQGAVRTAQGEAEDATRRTEARSRPPPPPRPPAPPSPRR